MQDIRNTTGNNDGYQQFGNTIYSIGVDNVIVNTERNNPQMLITDITGIYQNRFHESGTP